jgi:hypothetical protein
LRKSMLTLFRVALCPFKYSRSPSFLELFSDSPLSVFGSINAVQPLVWPSRKPSDLCGLELDGPP